MDKFIYYRIYSPRKVKDNRRRLPDELVKIIDERGVSYVLELHKRRESIERKDLNLTRLQNAELKDRRSAAEFQKKSKEQFDSINRELIKERFFDDFEKWGEEMISVSRAIGNTAWIEVQKEKLRKLCGRD